MSKDLIKRQKVSSRVGLRDSMGPPSVGLNETQGLIGTISDVKVDEILKCRSTSCYPELVVMRK